MALEVDLNGKSVLVCGVARGGIGGSVARQAARAGAAIIALDKDQDIIDATAEDIVKAGGTVRSYVADLLDRDCCDTVIPGILEKYGSVDAVANVAGGTRAEEWMPLDVTPSDSFWMTLQLNFGYIFNLCRDLAAHWIETGTKGAIVNVSSVSSLASAPWHGPYGASKSAITALTRTMANEWHEFGIRANSVLPGAVATERVLSKIKPDSVVGGETNFTEPDELANAIVFLLSDLASGISGQALSVDRSLSTKFCAGASRSRSEFEASMAQRDAG